MPDDPHEPDEERDSTAPSIAGITWKSAWRNLVLFVLTAVSIFFTGGPAFAVPLLAILLAHEFGHFFAARYHRVAASLPYFIPLPFIGMFGTLGAVIAMRGQIRSKNALLDIGASGPLAGLVVAIPVLFWGVAHSPVMPPDPRFDTQEGQSLLYALIKWLVHGSIPDGYDVQLHPTAFAGWAGLFLTMINLLPYGQLDGGHIAYALLGERQNRVAPWFRRALLPLFLVNLGWSLATLTTYDGPHLANAIGSSLFWLLWYGVLGLLSRLAGPGHPPVDPGELSPWRKAVAWLSLALFAALFMPTPVSHILP